MKKRISTARSALLIGLSFLGLAGCKAEHDNIGIDRMSSSSSSSSSSSGSTTSSSSSSSTNSSSSSGYGIPSGPSYELAVEEFCESSVGTTEDGVFQLQNAAEGRLDFPSIHMNLGPLYSSSASISYANPTGEDVIMRVWVNGAPIVREMAFPPTDGWQHIRLGAAGAHGQVSLTPVGDSTGLRVRGLYYDWKVDCSQSCGYSPPTIEACPKEPLPGVAQGDPVAPIARAGYGGGSREGAAPFTLSFDASNSYDANLESLNYQWDFDDGSEAWGVHADHTFEKPGLYYVSLTVTDPSGRSDHDLVEVIVTGNDSANARPVARITANRYNVLRPYTVVNLSGATSADPDGDSLDYVWYLHDTKEVIRAREFQLDLGDATFRSVQLGVSDERGGISFDTLHFRSMDPPEHSCQVQYSDRYPSFEINATLFNPTDVTLENWELGWLFDEEVTITEVSGAVADATHPYTFRGEAGQTDIPPHSWIQFRVTGESELPVTDLDMSLRSDLNCKEVMPARKNHAPVPVITASSVRGARPLEVVFSAEDSYDPDGDPLVSYGWSFGDGFRGEGKTVTHTYNGTGSFLARLVVSDGDKGALNVLFVNVEGEPGLECRAIFQNTNSSTGEFTARIYLENAGSSTAQIDGGTLNLSRPISVISADDNAGISISGSTTTVDFRSTRTVSPGAQQSIEFSGVMDDFDSTYFTSCTLY